MALHTLNKTDDPALLACLQQLLTDGDTLLLIEQALPLATDHEWLHALPPTSAVYALSEYRPDWHPRVLACNMSGFVRLAATLHPVISWY